MQRLSWCVHLRRGNYGNVRTWFYINCPKFMFENGGHLRRHLYSGLRLHLSFQCVGLGYLWIWKRLKIVGRLWVHFSLCAHLAWPIVETCCRYAWHWRRQRRSWSHGVAGRHQSLYRNGCSSPMRWKCSTTTSRSKMLNGNSWWPKKGLACKIYIHFLVYVKQIEYHKNRALC